MSTSNIYGPLWEKYKSLIVSKIKLALIEPQEYSLPKHEFEAIGNRAGSGYSFNIEIKNGILVNNLDGTAVARDLFETLKKSKTAIELMQTNHIKISMSKNFILKIQIEQV